jgi:hypothetical protein
VLVVPETEELAAIENVIGSRPVRSWKWVGTNPRKGLGAVSYGEYSLETHPAYDPRHHWVLPLAVDGPVPFTLFAVWTVPHAESNYYVQCLFEALDTYDELLKSQRVVWAGDFNNNLLFDRGVDPLNFSELLARFESYGLRSLYHLQHGCEHGAEPQDTFFYHHDAEQGHHLDFVFATPALYSGGVEVSSGDHATWSKLSDHSSDERADKAGQHH